MKIQPTVIFDMDGVIIDSEPIHRRITVNYFAQMGIHLQQEELEIFVGSSAKMNLTYIKNTYLLSEPIEVYMSDLKKQFMQHLREATDLQPIAGTRELIETLAAADYQLILGSSANRENINLVLSLLGLTDFFSHKVSGAELPESKPNPAIFLKAAELGGVTPNQCLVIEDSKNGVTAAKAAGMACIGHQNPNSGKQNITHADIVVQSMSDISLTLIDELLKKYA